MISEVWELWLENLSARQIAAQLTHKWKKSVSKNMIIGVVHRYTNKTGQKRKTLSDRPKTSHPRVRGGRAMMAGGVMKPREIPRKAFIHAKRNLKIIHGKTCQYLHGEPADRNFCGAPVVMDLDCPLTAQSWCAEHLTMILLPRGSSPEKKAIRTGGRVYWHPKEQMA